jgi:hypothetical protein
MPKTPTIDVTVCIQNDSLNLCLQNENIALLLSVQAFPTLYVNTTLYIYERMCRKYLLNL